MTAWRVALSDDVTGFQELMLPDPWGAEPERLPDPFKEEVDPLAAVGGACVWPA